MAEIFNILVWAVFIYILFIFLRGMNETQVQKHKDRLEEAELKKEQKEKNETKEQ